MTKIRGVCASCRRMFSYEHLDSKPTNDRYFAECATLGQYEAIQNAIDRNDDFDRLECEDCYGPGYVSLEGGEKLE